jgi:hypothetical protein
MRLLINLFSLPNESIQKKALSPRSRGVTIILLVAIPPFTSDGVLPPYTSATPNIAAGMSPFSATMLEVAQRFGTSRPRIQLLRALIDYRAALGGIGLADGFQWLDGSFIEQIEVTGGHAPNDIDLVTFYRRPTALRNAPAAWRQFVDANNHLFRPALVKLTYNCDAYYVDLDVSNPLSIVDQTRYWFGLFSHKRVSSLWKGLLQVPLQTPTADAEANALLVQREGETA